MKSALLWFSALVSLPVITCDSFDTVAALRNYGIDASNYDNGAPHAAVAGHRSTRYSALSERSAGSSGCEYSVSKCLLYLLENFY
jgi:hypothetical protein